MRQIELIKGDFRFQYKYGIFAIYVILIAVYIGLLAAIPMAVRQTVAIILIFTDPAAMGLFFMGAVILLEKSQRINCSLAVAPMKVSEYITAKVLSMVVTGTLIGMMLGIYAKIPHLFSATLGIGLSSIIFSLCGLLVAIRITSLNQFLLATVPFELGIFAPALLYLFGVIRGRGILFHPGIAAIALIKGEENIGILCVGILLAWIIILYTLCKYKTKKAFSEC
ncbi:MAG: ABC transporter permease [Lachnospiraceae bacterium]|nr:ABC transporter permease [Lachnospiraceae bacterium]